MKINIKDYSEVAKNLNHFIEVSSSKKVEDGSHLIEIKGKLYMLSNNGTETNIDLINSDVIYPSIPHTSNTIKVTPLVLAYRLATYINYGWGAINWGATDKWLNTILAEYKSREAINYTIHRANNDKGWG